MVQSLCECGLECYSQESRIKNAKAGRHLQDTGVHLPRFANEDSKTSVKKACPELKQQVSGQGVINSYIFFSQVKIGYPLPRPILSHLSVHILYLAPA